MTDDKDFLDELIAERSAVSPEFPTVLAEAVARRELLRALADERTNQGISQTKIAAAMDTSQSFVARLETSAADTKLSTIERYASTLGMKVQFRLLRADADEPSVIVKR